jgi:hypothetical protein
MRGRAVLTTLSLSLVASVAATSLFAPVALAQTPEAKAEAQKKAREGQRLADNGQHDQALAMFREAYAKNQEPGYLYNIGIEYQALGRDVEAFNTFDRFLRDVQKIPPEFIADANQQQRELRKRIGELEIRCTQEGARVTVDDREAQRTPIDEPVRVQAGTHRVAIQKDGFEPFQQSVSVTGGNKVRVEALMRPIPVNGTVAAATGASSLEPATSPNPGLRDTNETPPPANPGSRDQRPPLHISASAGAAFWIAGVPGNPEPSAALTLGAGYRIAEISSRVDFRLGAKFGLSFLSEPSNTDLFVSALVNPMLVIELVPSRLFAFAEVGAGILVISGVQAGSVLLRSGEAGSVSGALSAFELRPSIGAAYALNRSLSVFLAPSFTYSPSPDPVFVEPSISRLEIAAGATLHLL